MKRKILYSSILICILCIIRVSASNDTLSPQQLKNVMFYSKIQGGIQHFYPSKGSQKTDWEKMSIYGLQKVINCKDDDELIQQVKTLFEPICDELICSKKPIKQFPTEQSKGAYHIYEHYGIGHSKMRIPFLYNPYHVDVKRLKKHEPILLYTDSIVLPDQNALYFSIPTAAKRSRVSSEFKNLANSIDSIQTKRGDWKEKKAFFNVSNPVYRMANLILPWNEIRFFFPYNNLLNRDWDTALAQSLCNAYKTSDRLSLLKEIWRLFNPLNDGHLSIHAVSVVSIIKWVSSYSALPLYTLQAQLHYQNDTVIVVNVPEKYKDILPVKSIIDSVNGMSIKEYIEIRKLQLSGSEHKKNRIFHNRMFVQYENPEFVLDITTKEGEKKRVTIQETEERPYFNRDSGEFVQHLGSGIYLLNFSNPEISKRKIRKALKSLIKTDNLRGIIVDYRNPTVVNHRFLSFFTDKKIYSPEFKTPVVSSPGIIKRYESERFPIRPKRKTFDVPVTFLVSSINQSYQESILEIVSHYKLATLIGEPTAGCNGDMAGLTPLLFGITGLTGLVVERINGDTLYGIGIKPDIFIQNSIQDVTNDFDRQLQTAIEFIKRENEKKNH